MGSILGLTQTLVDDPDKKIGRPEAFEETFLSGTSPLSRTEDTSGEGLELSGGAPLSRTEDTSGEGLELSGGAPLSRTEDTSGEGLEVSGGAPLSIPVGPSKGDTEVSGDVPWSVLEAASAGDTLSFTRSCPRSEAESFLISKTASWLASPEVFVSGLAPESEIGAARHRRNPWGHAEAQVPLTQTLPPGQAAPQTPQLLGSDCRLTQTLAPVPPSDSHRVWPRLQNSGRLLQEGNSAIAKQASRERTGRAG